jgi:hypothetical protein
MRSVVMRRPRYFLNTILGVVIAAGCSNWPSEPEPQGPQLQASLVSSLGIASCPDPAKDKVSQNVGPAGGTVQVGPHVLVIPAGALSKDVTITATTGGKNGNAIEFGPDGLRFNSYVRLTMDLSNCTGWGLLKLPLIVYTSDLLSILEVEPSVLDAKRKTVTGFLTHFSQYAVAY